MMKTLDKEIVEIENFYGTATVEEAIAYFKQVSAKCFNMIKQKVIEMGSVAKRKHRSCLVPMRCKQVLRYSCRRLAFQKWKQNIRIELRMILSVSYISDHIEMEKLLAQVRKILSSE